MRIGDGEVGKIKSKTGYCGCLSHVQSIKQAVNLILFTYLLHFILQSKMFYHKYVHLLMMWSKIQDYVNSRWSFTYSVEYDSTLGTVCGGLDLIRRLPFVKSSTSNTHLFLSGHHLFTYIQVFFFLPMFLDQTEGPVFPLFPSAG